MPEFTNPFIGVVPDRKMTDSELIRAIRLNIAAEHEAVHIYMSHADATDNELARAVLMDIANEEREHIGEFQRLLRELAPDEAEYIDTGVAEVEEIIEEVESGKSAEEIAAEEEEEEEEGEEDVPTVGDMRD
jgi:rubrerythrin